MLTSPHATPKITNSPYKGPNSAQLTRNKPYLKQVNDDDDYDYPSPNFGKNHDRTVIQTTPNRLSFDSQEEESADSFSVKVLKFKFFSLLFIRRLVFGEIKFLEEIFFLKIIWIKREFECFKYIKAASR